MIILYALVFCRVTVGLIFIWSFVGKVRDFSSFVKTIDQFRLLPKALHRLSALSFLAGELIVVIFMIIGKGLLVWGFLLAILMLFVFTIGLISVVLRKIQTPCNCFGTSQKLITSYDIIRNIGFFLCSLSGYCLLINGTGDMTPISWLGWGLVGAIAFIFIVLSVQLEELIQLFRSI